MPPPPPPERNPRNISKADGWLMLQMLLCPWSCTHVRSERKGWGEGGGRPWGGEKGKKIAGNEANKLTGTKYVRFFKHTGKMYSFVRVYLQSVHRCWVGDYLATFWKSGRGNKHKKVAVTDLLATRLKRKYKTWTPTMGENLTMNATPTTQRILKLS